MIPTIQNLNNLKCYIKKAREVYLTNPKKAGRLLQKAEQYLDQMLEMDYTYPKTEIEYILGN